MDTNESKIRIAIAEDETATRQMLQTHLASFSNIDVVATVNNGRELLETFEQINPSAVFLDVEMPELDGLSAAAALKEKNKYIYIVFVTGYPKYAADAFQLEAVDYLVKPVTKEHLERAVGRIEKYIGLRNKNDKRNQDILILKNNHETNFINPDDIYFIEKENKKTIVHTANGKYTTSEPLNVIGQKLNQNFFRCHKSFIVNIKKIEKIFPIADRIYHVTFNNYQNHVTMGRQKLEELYRLIAK
jgi:DNA-binding LytR/AlgR family response regulator